MDLSFEKRLFIAFLISTIFILASYYLLPKPAQNITTNQNERVLKEEKKSFAIEDFNFITTGLNETNRIQSDEIIFEVENKGGRITALYIDGKWNQKKAPLNVYNHENPFRSGDFFFGELNLQKKYDVRPLYKTMLKDEKRILLSSDLTYNGKKVNLVKSFSYESNYQILMEFAISNSDVSDIEFNFDGISFSVGFAYGFDTRENKNPANIVYAKYFDKKVRKTLSGGLFRRRALTSTVVSPEWIAIHNNYFIAICKPEFTNYTARFLLEKDEKFYSEIVYGIELPPLKLTPGQSASYKLRLYIGPKSENILAKINKSYKKLFSWPILFNWFMKPIEKGMYYLAHFIASIIKNWGITIIVLAFLIKLMLSPLSIQAAVSIKKSNLLQPKLKKLQEKYRDNPEILNQKIAELYRKEKVNPLGGCLPLLLQFPVFFVLYRVLSSSVELKGATFLWIKDLTMPDTLFKMNIPFLPSSFNLLPIIMTIIQIIQMKIQSMRTPTTQQQQMLNTYLLPVFFLFIFWNMPSGLVLYWTVQNIFSIIEQEIINVDKKIGV